MIRIPLSPSRHPYVWRLSLLITSCLLAILFGEGIVRFFRLAPLVLPIALGEEESVYERSENPALGYVMKPNYRNPNPDFIETFRRTNAQGFRDVERNAIKSPDVTRVILLGDSVVVGNGLSDLEDTIPLQIEQLSDKRIEALNFGVAGYCTYSEVELLVEKGLQFDPDVVLLMFNGTDYQDLNFMVARYGPVRERPVWVNNLFYHSDFFRLIALRTNFMDFAHESNIEEWNSSAIGDDSVRKGVERLALLADEHDFIAAVLVWPDFRDDNIVRIADYGLVFDTLAIREIAQSHGVPDFWLKDEFQRVWKENGSPNPRIEYTTGDGIHASKAGARIAAEAIIEIVDGLIDKQEPTTSVPDQLH